MLLPHISHRLIQCVGRDWNGGVPRFTSLLTQSRPLLIILVCILMSLPCLLSCLLDFPLTSLLLLLLTACLRGKLCYVGIWDVQIALSFSYCQINFKKLCDNVFSEKSIVRSLPIYIKSLCAEALVRKREEREGKCSNCMSSSGL